MEHESSSFYCLFFINLYQPISHLKTIKTAVTTISCKLAVGYLPFDKMIINHTKSAINLRNFSLIIFINL